MKAARPVLRGPRLGNEPGLPDGARTDEHTQVHLLAAFDPASGTVLGQTQVESKSNEITAFAPLLDRLDLTDVLLTADALHTQRAHAEYLHDRGGH